MVVNKSTHPAPLVCVYCLDIKRLHLMCIIIRAPELPLIVKRTCLHDTMRWCQIFLIIQISIPIRRLAVLCFRHDGH